MTAKHWVVLVKFYLRIALKIGLGTVYLLSVLSHPYSTSKTGGYEFSGIPKIISLLCA